MNRRIIPSTAIEEGLDRQNLAILRKRFLAINSARLERIQSALGDRQQIFLSVLPILFHTNHPMMPGFISHHTPARISCYAPSKHDVLLAKQIARSFTLRADPQQEDDIYGIYVMGSVGTIAQSDSSDLDIWLCYRPNLSSRALCQLNEKCERISAWAAELRLEVHFFLMNHETFKRGEKATLNTESSGSAQQSLLLDEFYRTAIFVTGRMPIWWFIPTPEEERFDNYANTLTSRRFVSVDNYLDFGGIATIPIGEFLGAGVWQLYKAIESPYKSVLKLLLLETYVSEYPNITPLSLNFKHEVYSGNIDIDSLDSYVMIYRRIEKYLSKRQQFKRLELARRCLYFKINKPLSKPPSQRTKSWQRILLENLVEEWGWKKNHIRYLDGRGDWKTPFVTRERSQLVGELNHSYRFLLDFANNTGATRVISAEELTVLGRKLQAAFERRPGKIEWINPNISGDLSEQVLSIAKIDDHDQSQTVFTAFAHPVGGATSAPGTAIKSTNHVVELILWLYFNGVIDADTQFEINNTPEFGKIQLRRVLGAMRSWLPLPLPELKHTNFQSASRPQAVLLLLNTAKSSSPDLDEKGLQRLSDNTDALRYGGFEENLVAAVDMISRNSWNEITTHRFDDKNALLGAVLEFLHLSLPGSSVAPPKVTVECIGASHTTTINHRIEQWLGEIKHCFFSGIYPPQTRFLFQMENRFFCIQYRDLKPHLHDFKSEAELIDFLSVDQKKYSPLVIDSNALHKHPLRIISGKSKSNCIDIFFHRFDIGVELYLVDEKGSVSHLAFRGRRNHNPLKTLHRFLRAVLNREALTNPDFDIDFGIFPINFYELHHDNHHRYAATSRAVTPESGEIAKFEVKATAHFHNEQIRYDFHCDNQEFLAQDFNEQLFMVVAKYILSRRQVGENYPVYLTDLDLGLAKDAICDYGQLQITHYINIKHQLEYQLNQAIGILLNA